jgi:Mce-associated membrane protein
MSTKDALAERDDVGEQSMTDDAVPPAEVGPPAPGAQKREPWVLGWVLLALGLVVAVSGSVAWWTAAHSEDLQLARTRDAVLIAATSDVATLNSLDYRDVEGGLDGWKAVTTGTLHDQFAGLDAKDRELLADQRKISKGRVVEAAVLDVDGATAEVIASVETTVRDGEDADAEPVVKRNRFTATLQRSGGTWKVSDLQQLAVDLS